MIPLSDSSRRPVEFPAVTVWLIAMNVVAFGLELLGGDEFVLAWSATPAVIASGGNWLTLLTAMFLHGGGVAFAAQIVVDPTSTIPPLEASGAVAAVMGAFLVRYPHDRIKTLVPIGPFLTLMPIRAASGGLFLRTRFLDDGEPPWEPTTRFGRHL